MLRLKRAKVHLKTLHQSIDRFREKHAYRLTRHERHEGRFGWACTWDVERTEPYPFYWPVLIGETLYELNSALDHLAWQVARLKSAPDEPDRVTFPIFTSQKRFWRRNKAGAYRQGSGGWRMLRVPKDARQLFLDVQPYKSRDRAPKHPLALLFTLSNEDKHQAFQIAWAAATKQKLEGLRVHNCKVVSFKIDKREPFNDRMNNLASLRVVFTGPNAKIEVEPMILFEEVFGKGSPDNAAGELVYETLRGIYNYVLEEVFKDRFLPYFDGRAEVTHHAASPS